MNFIMKAVKHFIIITKHKYYVMQACFKAGLIRQGIFHDLSKFSPIEFWESVRYYTGTRSPIDLAKEDKGYSIAWLHHRGQNPHHYEYWIDYLDNGGIAIEIPFKYALEMVCDYIGAGKAYSREKWSIKTPVTYWNEIKKPFAKIHPNTKNFFNEIFEEFSEKGWVVIKKSHAKKIYDKYHRCK